ASLEDDNQMCLCGMLAAESAALPPAVVTETRRFFERLISAVAGPEADTAARQKALSVVAQLEGALLTARVLGNPSSLDRPCDGWCRAHRHQPRPRRAR
ncbi:MAG: hypothetical protein AAFV38_05205, partial [Pseudomonadota bacterium]